MPEISVDLIALPLIKMNGNSLGKDNVQEEVFEREKSLEGLLARFKASLKIVVVKIQWKANYAVALSYS